MHPSSLFEANRCFSLHVPTGGSHTNRWKIYQETTTCSVLFFPFLLQRDFERAAWHHTTFTFAFRPTEAVQGGPSAGSAGRLSVRRLNRINAERTFMEDHVFFFSFKFCSNSLDVWCQIVSIFYEAILHF